MFTLFYSQGFFDEYVGVCLLWMKINVLPIVPVEDMALVQVRRTAQMTGKIRRNKPIKG